MSEAEAQHKKRRRPIWLILLILFFLCILMLLCWWLIWPILQPPPATDVPTDSPIVTETATSTDTATPTDTATSTCVPGTEGCSDPNPQPTATDTATATNTATSEPPDLIFDPIEPDFQLAWNESCSSYTISADLDLLVRNQGSSSSGVFAVSFAIYDETKQTALSSITRLDFATIEADNSESQSSTLTVSINKSQIQVSHNTLYLIVDIDVDNQVEEVDESNNRIEIPIEILACGKGA